MILRVQHIGVVVRDLEDACARFERVLGLKARDFRDDQGQGMQLDARILLGNECWLHLVENWNPESRVNRFLRERGEGLEHICLETDDIEADVAHLREIGVGVWEDRILDANDGYEAFVYPDQLPGLTVELIQSHERSWYYPPDAVGEPVSDSMNLVRLRDIGLRVNNLADACARFDRFFGLVAEDVRDDLGAEERPNARIPFPNQCRLHLVENRNAESSTPRFPHLRGEGMDQIALETTDVEADVATLREHGILLLGDAIHDARDGRRARVHPDQLPGMTAELIQPHANGGGFGP